MTERKTNPTKAFVQNNTGLEQFYVTVMLCFNTTNKYSNRIDA